jgi:hypothetical protein
MADTAIRIKSQKFASKGWFFGFYFYFYAGRKAGLS